MITQTPMTYSVGNYMVLRWEPGDYEVYNPKTQGCWTWHKGQQLTNFQIAKECAEWHHNYDQEQI